MPTVRCPGCDDTVEIEPDWYGRRVACPACDRQFTARRPSDDPDEDYEDRKPRRRRAWEDDEDDDPKPRRTKSRRREERPQGMSRGGKQLMVLGIVGGTLLLVCGGCVGLGWFWIFAPVNYSNAWVPQTLPDGSYTVQFPKRPDSEPLGDSFSGTAGTKYLLVEELPKDAAFAFGYLDTPGLPFDDAWRAEVAEIGRAAGAKAGAERPITSAGCSGKEVDFKAGGVTVTYRLLEVPGRRGRYLLVLAGGRNVSDADRKKFLDSLTANGR